MPGPGLIWPATLVQGDSCDGGLKKPTLRCGSIAYGLCQSEYGEAGNAVVLEKS